MLVVMQNYIPLNKENTHWVTVVKHSGKRELQVLDSLMTGKFDSVTRELVDDLVSLTFKCAFGNIRFL